MSKQAWTAHMAEVGFESTSMAELGLERFEAARVHMRGCAVCADRKRTRKANVRANERSRAMRDLGLTKTAYGWE